MELTLNDIFSMLKKRIALILTVVLLFVSFSFIYTQFFLDNQYSSSVKAYITPAGNTSSSVTYVRDIVGTYIEILRSHEFYDRVSTSLNEEYTSAQLKSITSFSQKEGSEIFTISVTASSPDEAKRIADALSDHAPYHITNITGNENLIIAERALNGTPIGPSLATNVFIGAVLGFIISVAYIFLHELLKKNIDCIDDITNIYNIPIFGIVPPLHNKKK